MKLILTQEVSGLGAAGDIVEVKDGYGRNFLIPRGFAIRWTKGGERTVDSIKAARSSREVRDLDHAKQIKARLEGTAVQLPVRAG
jgi:large subunit ribosomal protein L9